jgi:Zn-dependent metalloprotease
MEFLKQCDEILMRATIKKFDEVTLAYLNVEDFNMLWNLIEDKKSEFELEGMNGKKEVYLLIKNKFKIINPDNLPIKVTNFAYTPTYSLVNDREKILTKHLDKDFNIWVNKMNKNKRELLKEAKTEKEVQQITDKFDTQIKRGREYYERIKNNEFDEVIRTDYEFVTELYKPYIYFKYFDKNGKLKNSNSYLRKEVLNVVYEADLIIPKKSKSKIQDRLRKLKNVFGYYYIKE